MARKRKRPLIFVCDLTPGTTVDSCFFLRQIAPNAGNGPKLRARIWDRTGEAALIVWEWDPRVALADGPYRVVGTVGTYAGSVQVCADRLEACPLEADLMELLPAAPRPIAAMWADLERLCAGCGSPPLRALFNLILADQALCERWQQAPAAVRHHHAYLGGLLEHSLGVARVALAIADHYPALDRDLLLAGALLHDLGKTEAYRIQGTPDMTDQGRLLGHVYPGAYLVHRFIERLPDFPPELRDRLLHLIGSHHGERQFGVLEVPKTPEAVVLHYADNVDAKLSAVFAACQQANGQAWTAPVRSLQDERVFVGSGNATPAMPAPGTLDLLDDPFQGSLFACDDPDA